MEDSSIIFWKLLSIFDLTIDEQLTVIGKLPDKKLTDPHITNLYLFSCALNTYLSSWFDEFDFLYNEIEDKPSEIY